MWQAANLLISSADNGELRKALQGLSQQSPRHETVQKTASLLAEAAENGALLWELLFKGFPSFSCMSRLQNASKRLKISLLLVAGF